MIFFDFDGTVVDLWPRYHQVFLAASGLSGISQQEYMEAKRALVSDSKVAQHFGGALSEEYFTKKRELLEAEQYLRLDMLLVSLAELNAVFSSEACRFLTCRRRPKALFTEMDGLGLGHLSDHVIVLDPDQGISKKEYLMRNVPQGPHIVVGDSKAEWEAASDNIRAVLVRTGLRWPEDFPLTDRHTVAPSLSAFISDYLSKKSHQHQEEHAK